MATRNGQENRASLHGNLSPVRGELQSGRAPVPKPGRQRKLAIRVEMRRRNFDSRGVEDAIYERQNSPLNNIALRLYVSSLLFDAAVAALFHVYSAPQTRATIQRVYDPSSRNAISSLCLVSDYFQ